MDEAVIKPTDKLYTLDNWTCCASCACACTCTCTFTRTSTTQAGYSLDDHRQTIGWWEARWQGGKMGRTEAKVAASRLALQSKGGRPHFSWTKRGTACCMVIKKETQRDIHHFSLFDSAHLSCCIPVAYLLYTCPLVPLSSGLLSFDLHLLTLLTFHFIARTSVTFCQHSLSL